MDTPGRLGEVTLANGRVVEYWDGGAPDQPAILVHPGTPSSRRFGLHLHAEAASAGVRLVSLSRPGYGGSTNTTPGLASVAGDTWGVADLLHLEAVSVLGISGGGPYALAVAALAPDRVRAVGIAAGVGPRSEIEPCTDEGEAEKRHLAAARAGDLTGAIAGLLADAEGALGPLLALDDAAMVEAFFSNVPAGASRRVGDPGFRTLWAGDLREALRSYDGFVRDNLTWGNPWDVDPASVRSPCFLWYGETDVMVPASHGHRLADQIPGSELTVFPGEGHGAVTFDHVPDMLHALSL